MSKPIIRIFISSTFSDFKSERDALHDRVFPKLAKLCEQNGASFQPIDLRWGVNESAAIDQRTMQICLEEIARCQQISPRPNFIALLGDRYGWQPLPDTIPESEFKLTSSVIEQSNIDDLNKLNSWYKCDENAVPPEYILQPRKGKYADDFSTWEVEEAYLRQMLRTAVSKLDLSDSSRGKYELSATGQEILRGALDTSLENVEEHVFAFYRTIDSIPSDSSIENLRDYIDVKGNTVDNDAKERLGELKQNVKVKLKDNVTEYQAQWTANGITTNHIDAFCDDVYEKLEKVIQKQISEFEAVVALEKEVNEHLAFASERMANFIGRTKELDSVQSYLSQSNEINTPLIIHGHSGTGKSAFISEAARRARLEHKSSVCVQRFIGVTPSSSSAYSLLHNILLQVAERYGKSAADLPTEYKELLNVIPDYLSLSRQDKPLILFIDALDQLNTADAATLSDWLPSKLPKYTCLIVSTTEDTVYDTVKSTITNGQYLVLPPMEAEEGRKLLNVWLEEEGRKLTEKQEKVILEGFNSCGLPLYLKLSFEQAKLLHSYDEFKSTANDLRGLISQLVAQLSQEHSPILVDRVFDYLAISRHGLTENELLDVLSLDNEVMTSFNEGQFHEYSLNTLPTVIWSRLYADLKPYLMERDVDGVSILTFFHRQFMEVAVKECLEEREIPILSEYLSNYFSNQNNFLDEHRLYPNTRKLMELPYHLIGAHKWKQLQSVLTNFDFCMAKCQLNESDDLVLDYRETIRQIPTTLENFVIWESFIRESAHILRRGNDQWSANKILLQLAVEHADDSPVTIAAEQWLDNGNCDWIWSRNVQRPVKVSDSLRSISYEGSLNNVLGLTETKSGTLLTWSNNNIIKEWDVNSGVNINNIAHEDCFLGGLICLDKERYLSWSDGLDLFLWYKDNYKDRQALNGHTGTLRGALILPDNKVMSWSDDCTLRIWDTNKCKLVKTIFCDKKIVDVCILIEENSILMVLDDVLLCRLGLGSNELEIIKEFDSQIVALSESRILSDGNGIYQLYDYPDIKLIGEIEHKDPARYIQVPGSPVLRNHDYVKNIDEQHYLVWDKAPHDLDYGVIPSPKPYYLLNFEDNTMLETQISAIEGRAKIIDDKLYSWNCLGDTTISSIAVSDLLDDDNPLCKEGLDLRKINTYPNIVSGTWFLNGYLSFFEIGLSYVDPTLNEKILHDAYLIDICSGYVDKNRAIVWNNDRGLSDLGTTGFNLDIITFNEGSKQFHSQFEDLYDIHFKNEIDFAWLLELDKFLVLHNQDEQLVIYDSMANELDSIAVPYIDSSELYLVDYLTLIYVSNNEEITEFKISKDGCFNGINKYSVNDYIKTIKFEDVSIEINVLYDDVRSHLYAEDVNKNRIYLSPSSLVLHQIRNHFMNRDDSNIVCINPNGCLENIGREVNIYDNASSDDVMVNKIIIDIPSDKRNNNITSIWNCNTRCKITEPSFNYLDTTFEFLSGKMEKDIRASGVIPVSVEFGGQILIQVYKGNKSVCMSDIF